MISIVLPVSPTFVIFPVAATVASPSTNWMSSVYVNPSFVNAVPSYSFSALALVISTVLLVTSNV